MLLPYAVHADGHVVVRAGDRALDLAVAEGLGVGREVFSCGSLDAFMDLGPEAWAATHQEIASSIGDQPDRAWRPVAELELVLAWSVGDFVDFYSSRHHVETMGRMLRPGEDPLPPAWLHVPLGYHGRSGSVVVSGGTVLRPSGVFPSADGEPGYGPTKRLDAEVELGFIVGTGVARGRALDATEAERHIFGMVLLNDWSARDIQAFEYRPLGPFLGKSFATSVSAWVVPYEALRPHRVEGPVQQPPPAGYLRAPEPRNVAVELRLSVNGRTVATSCSSDLYWAPAQMAAHLTANGAGLRRGDLFATGAISGPGASDHGSLMEAWRGDRWLADGDVVSIEGRCGREPIGPVSATIGAP